LGNLGHRTDIAIRQTGIAGEPRKASCQSKIAQIFYTIFTCLSI
jgi:hypothetical protein